MLDNYTLSYYIVSLPNFIHYSCLTPAKQYLHFEEDLSIPEEYVNQPIDCFFNLYDDKGELVASTHEQAIVFSLKAIINTSPLKMLMEFLKKVKES